MGYFKIVSSKFVSCFKVEIISIGSEKTSHFFYSTSSIHSKNSTDLQQINYPNAEFA